MNSLQLCSEVPMSNVEMLREPMGHLGPKQGGQRGQGLCNKREVARTTSGSCYEIPNVRRDLPSFWRQQD